MDIHKFIVKKERVEGIKTKLDKTLFYSEEVIQGMLSFTNRDREPKKAIIKLQALVQTMPTKSNYKYKELFTISEFVTENLKGSFNDVYFSLPVDEYNLITKHMKDKDKQGHKKLLHYLQTMQSLRVKVEFFLKVVVSY
jgi:hypothetical protein